jgi:hypothetical protein
MLLWNDYIVTRPLAKLDKIKWSKTPKVDSWVEEYSCGCKNTGSKLCPKHGRM